MLRSPVTMLLAAIALLTSSSCTTLVQLTVKNESQAALAGGVDVRDKNGVRTKEIQLGRIEPGAEHYQEFKVKNGSSFKVIGTLPGSAVVDPGNLVSVTGDQDPFPKTVSLQSRSRNLDDSTSFKTISQSFKNTGTDVGARPLGLENALQTRLGALIVAVPRGEGQEPEILYSIDPKTLGVQVNTLDDVRFPGTNEVEEVNIKGQVATNASGSYGPLAHFGVNFHNDSVYELRWVLRGFGTYVKKEDSAKDYAVQYNLLPEEHRQQIAAHLEERPEAQIFYVNELYVLRNADLFIREAKKLSASAEFDAASLVSGSTAYTFENTNEKNHNYGPVALNYWGVRLMPLEVPSTGFDPGGVSALWADPESVAASVRGGTSTILVMTGEKQRFSFAR